ncbi:MAG: CPBP family intramembrane metalloprotease [Candidatus Heimdallarchaeota archaeon]|nr:CPBP family intramembrane metalloprotease [Candidatus Heimdallarchaeota archaeon]
MKDTTTHEIMIYVLLSYMISWSFWGAFLVIQSYYTLFLILGAFGPFVSAILVESLIRKNSVNAWLRSNFRIRGKLIYLLLTAFIVPISMGILSQFFYYSLGGTGDLITGGWEMYIFALLGTTLLSGGNEEPGWRGFLTPLLEKRYSFLKSNLIVAPIWTFWHVPLMFSEEWSGASQNLFWMILYTFALSIILSTLYKISGSIWPVMVLHAATNVVFGYFPKKDIVLFNSVLDFIIIKTLVYSVFACITVGFIMRKQGLDNFAPSNIASNH